MALKFSVSGRIARPAHEVFEAVADPKELSHYFTTGGAKGRLETGATVYWDFHDFPGAFPVEVADDQGAALADHTAQVAAGHDDIAAGLQERGDVRFAGKQRFDVNRHTRVGACGLDGPSRLSRGCVLPAADPAAAEFRAERAVDR